MLRAVVIFGALVVAAWGQTTQVNQCTVYQGELPLNTFIAGCDTLPCRLPQLEDVVINIIFRAPRAMSSMKTLATAYLSLIGLPVPIPYDLGDNAYTCNFLDNSYCPVVEGEILVYTLYMYIESTFPVGISPTIEFRIVDQDGGAIVCIRVPITITAPKALTARNSTVKVVDTA
ncbi:NPC intracellular cholesterol transporter 2 homolog a-like isoform X2 [Choristoneura fumiferana]|uniref:NPC intracellular cholesterol transporter 2 homolog a-like isoform X2 n=1 Tax=Choristoneura fumiferana TaxID=7141 RepID=UPI003D156637